MKYTLFTMLGNDGSTRKIAIRRDLVRGIEEVGKHTIIYFNGTRMEPYGEVSQILVEEEFEIVFSRLSVIVNVRKGYEE